jgi:hypothetical protein
MSLWRTPARWFRDLPTEAKLNEKFYTHKFGCWAAAITERLPRRRRSAGGNRLGSLLLRLPLAKWAGVALAFPAVPLWVRMCFGEPGDLRREYQRLYLVRGVDPAVALNQAARRTVVSYPVWMRAGGLALGTVEGASRTQLLCDPAKLHAWLAKDVYRGSLWWVYLRLLNWSLGGLVAGWAAGHLIDWRRRVLAMDGIHRRGVRLVSISGWNRKSIGPFSMRKKIGMYLRVSANGELAKISAQAMTTHWLNLGKTGSARR